MRIFWYSDAVLTQPSGFQAHNLEYCPTIFWDRKRRTINTVCEHYHEGKKKNPKQKQTNKQNPLKQQHLKPPTKEKS